MMIHELLEMLTYRRPHNSKTEEEFIQRYIDTLEGVAKDPQGNRWVVRGSEPTILWSAHTDTVHKYEGRQVVEYSNEIVLTEDKQSNCLGADDAVGVWVLRQMVLKGVPGLYIFHRGEERGGIGSEYIAQEYSEVIEGLSAAVAFDRRDTHSIITHQCVGRTCSDAFGWSLAEALRMGHVLDDMGTFTDTASYAHIIRECTNVSAGYMWEHSRHETLDLLYVQELLDAVLSADFSSLVIERDLVEEEGEFAYDLDYVLSDEEEYDRWFDGRYGVDKWCNR